MNHTYPDCLLEVSPREPKFLNGVAVRDWDGQSLSERIIHILKSLSKLL